MKQSFSFAYSKILIRGVDKVDDELTTMESTHEKEKFVR
jgi:hypothetical protein